MNRAERRHLQKRAKQRIERRLNIWLWSAYPTPRTIGIGAKTRKICSHQCCCTRRKYDGMTLQERRDYQDYLEQLEDLWITH